MPRKSLITSFRDIPRHVRMAYLRAQFYRTAFATPAGKEVLQDLYKFCGMNADMHVPGDPYQTAYMAGMRRVGLRIASMMGMDEAAALRIANQQPQIDDTEGDYS